MPAARMAQEPTPKPGGTRGAATLPPPRGAPSVRSPLPPWAPRARRTTSTASTGAATCSSATEPGPVPPSWGPTRSVRTAAIHRAVPPRCRPSTTAAAARAQAAARASIRPASASASSRSIRSPMQAPRGGAAPDPDVRCPALASAARVRRQGRAAPTRNAAPPRPARGAPGNTKTGHVAEDERALGGREDVPTSFGLFPATHRLGPSSR
jgi:hypothetical protein